MTYFSSSNVVSPEMLDALKGGERPFSQLGAVVLGAEDVEDIEHGVFVDDKLQGYFGVVALEGLEPEAFGD